MYVRRRTTDQRHASQVEVVRQGHAPRNISARIAAISQSRGEPYEGTPRTDGLDERVGGWSRP